MARATDGYTFFRWTMHNSNKVYFIRMAHIPNLFPPQSTFVSVNLDKQAQANYDKLSKDKISY